ncbi:nucleotide pyrophosphohydrolase [Metabacillus halosaccharovorans]|uniref:Nucleotide pyrophosphohydrolase n=1 Tax=Metabacillus halosaccharovorans TaxID=930124 RepID=A0ABT3DAT5_9BACI|nr:nucleotide pyrophosphohydrolase [Metabacillus halosaccharovorans]MCV9884148.1 nucleotide pyrophosphohydrolase [Metabacillus halosaccharovorans]
MSEFKRLTDMVLAFRDERDWQQFHNPKDLAISLSLEASELLENFQWKTSEEAVGKNSENIKDELADIVIYALLFANETGIDLVEAIEQKIQKNNEKYPVEKAYGSKTKYSEY